MMFQQRSAEAKHEHSDKDGQAASGAGRHGGRADGDDPAGRRSPCVHPVCMVRMTDEEEITRLSY